LPRETLEIETSLGRVAVKRIIGEQGFERLVPEYEACRRLAREKRLSIREIYALIAAETAAWPQATPPQAGAAPNGASRSNPDVDKQRSEG
jgi:uncharacterized protein (DUF111 family)